MAKRLGDKPVLRIFATKVQKDEALQFLEVCKDNNSTPSAILRSAIRDAIKNHKTA